METGDLPQFDSESTYLLSGETLNTIMNYIREKTVVLSGGTFAEVGPDGSKVNVLELQVCINGAAATKKFLTAE